MLLFRNGILQYSAPTKTMRCSLPPPRSSAVCWRGELGAQKAKTTGWDKNCLLEVAIRLENEEEQPQY